MGVWNPRYECYAKAHGRGPAEMLAFDRERSPGGCMAEFTIWIQARWREWRTANGYGHNDPLSNQEHKEFDAWISRAA